MAKECNHIEEESFLACEPSSWGGQWTEEKLDAFEKYVNAYLTIMNASRDKYNFEYGEDKKIGSMIVNDKCKALAQKINELIDVQSSFSDWLNNSYVRADLNQKIFFCLAKNGYPPQFNDEVFEL